GQLLAVVVGDDAGNVGMRLTVRRYTLVLPNSLRTCVVSGQGLRGISVVLQQQLSQVPTPAVNVFRRIEAVLDAQVVRRLRHELHQSLRAFARDSASIVAALGANHASNEVGIDLAARTGGVDDPVQVLLGRHRRVGGFRLRRSGLKALNLRGGDIDVAAAGFSG